MLKQRGWIRLVSKIVIFIVLFCLLVAGLNIMVYPADSWAQRVLKDMYQTMGTVDFLFLGTSGTYRSNIPVIYEETLDKVAFNLAIPAETFLGSYYLLKEALSYGKPELVFLHINVKRLQLELKDHNYQMQAIENMRWGPNKIAFLAQGTSVDKYAESTIKSYRSRRYFRWSTIKKNLSYRPEDEEFPPEVISYIGNGYRPETEGQIPGQVSIERPAAWSEEKVKAQNLYYLEKIMALCRAEGIQVVLFTTPNLLGDLLGQGDYGAYHAYAEAIAREADVPFWDLNYLRPEKITFSDEMFRDGPHPNHSLAVPLTELMAEMVGKYQEGTLDLSEYMFSTHEEYLQAHDRVAAVFIENPSKRQVRVYALAGGDGTAWIQASVATEKDGTYTLAMKGEREFSLDISDFPAGTYWIRAEAWPTGAREGEPQQTAIKQITIK